MLKSKPSKAAIFPLKFHFKKFFEIQNLLGAFLKRLRSFVSHKNITNFVTAF